MVVPQPYPLFLAEVIEDDQADTVDDRILVGRVIAWDVETYDYPVAYLMEVDHQEGMATYGARRRSLTGELGERPVFFGETVMEAVGLARAWGQRTGPGTPAG